MPMKRAGPSFRARSRSFRSWVFKFASLRKVWTSSRSFWGCSRHSISRISVPVAASSAADGSSPPIQRGDSFVASGMTQFLDIRSARQNSNRLPPMTQFFRSALRIEIEEGSRFQSRKTDCAQLDPVHLLRNVSLVSFLESPKARHLFSVDKGLPVKCQPLAL